MQARIKTVASSAVAFGAAATIGYTTAGSFVHAPEIRSRATWIERHTSLASLARSADAVISGQVVDIQSGRSVASSDPEVPALHFSNVVLRVSEAVKGDIRRGDPVTVEVVGDYVSKGGSRPGRIEGIPDFHNGGRFLLFLKRQTEAPFEWYVLNNQSGYSIRGSGPQALVRAADHLDGVAAELDHLTLPIAIQRIEAALRREE
jgi:hypothetical protein